MKAEFTVSGFRLVPESHLDVDALHNIKVRCVRGYVVDTSVPPVVPPPDGGLPAVPLVFLLHPLGL